MKNIRLIFLCVFVNLALGNSTKFIVFVDEKRNAVENNFVFVFVGWVIQEFFTVVSECSFSYDFGFFDIADVEEDSCVSEWFLFRFRARNGDFVDLDFGAEKRLDYSLNLLFKVLVIKIFSFVFLNLFL